MDWLQVTRERQKNQIIALYFWLFTCIYLYLHDLYLVRTNRNIYLPVYIHTYVCINTHKYIFTYIFIFNPHQFNSHQYIHYLYQTPTTPGGGYYYPHITVGDTEASLKVGAGAQIQVCLPRKAIWNPLLGFLSPRSSGSVPSSGTGLPPRIQPFPLALGERPSWCSSVG